MEVGAGTVVEVTDIVDVEVGWVIVVVAVVGSEAAVEETAALVVSVVYGLVVVQLTAARTKAATATTNNTLVGPIRTPSTGAAVTAPFYYNLGQKLVPQRLSNPRP